MPSLERFRTAEQIEAGPQGAGQDVQRKSGTKEIMGPGDYRVSDFLRAGSVMTILFLVVSLLMLNLVF